MIIIRDTREKAGKGWSFAADKVIEGTVEKALKTGDYSIEGYENEICVERKGNVSEWAGNVTQARFLAELERMRGMKAYVLLEFEVADLLSFPPPYLRKRGVKVGGAFLLKKTVEFSLMYGVHIMFVGKKGKEVAKQIFSSFQSGLKNE